MELIGWVSAALLAGCMLPQCIKVVQDGNALGTSWGMLLMWGGGEAGAIVYTCSQALVLWPLVANYTLNLALLAVLLAYKVKDRKRCN